MDGHRCCGQGTNSIEVINRIARIFQSVNQYMAHDSGGTVVESHRGKFGERTAHHMLLQQGG